MRILAKLLFLALVLCTAALLGAYALLKAPAPGDEAMAAAFSAFKRHGGVLTKSSLVTLIDYDLPVFSKRLYILDAGSREVLFQCRVSHAKKTGWLFARHFSNVPESNTSSIGAFRTGETYHGNYGYAMRIDGLTPGVNDNVRRRAIVFHKHPTLWSNGCFMSSPENNRRIIDMIHGGALVYAHRTEGKGSLTLLKEYFLQRIWK